MALNVLSASHGMSAIWDVHYWEVSFYFFELIYTLSNIFLLQIFTITLISQKTQSEYETECQYKHNIHFLMAQQSPHYLKI